MSEPELAAHVVALAASLNAEARKQYAYRLEQLLPIPGTQEILDGPEELRIAFILHTADLFAAMRDRLGKPEQPWDSTYANLGHDKQYPRAAVVLSEALLRKKLPFTTAQLIRFISQLAHLEHISTFAIPILPATVRLAAKADADQLKNKEFRAAVKRLAEAVKGYGADERRLVEKLDALLAGPQRMVLQPGESWSDRALADLETMSEATRDKWLELLVACREVSGGAPSAKWCKLAASLLKKIGLKQFKRLVLAWFALVDQPRTQAIANWNRDWQPDPNQLIIEPHADILKGLIWTAALQEDAEVARALTVLGLSAYRKLPKLGPRAVKIGNACVTALGMMPGMEGVGQLAILKVRVKFGTAQKVIEKALETTARRVGLPREELEEMAVPAYGLTEVGLLTESFGEYTAELTVTGPDSTSLAWIRKDGQMVQTIPAAVKTGFASDLKELQTAAKDIQRMLPAQRERLDSLFLQQRSWPGEVWEERYLNHPLIGVLARRLLWNFTVKGRAITGIWHDGRMVDQDLRPLGKLPPETVVTLWHPIDRPAHEIVAWRKWLEDQRIQQPFKQAHREVYLLTEAERQTRTYSNRYAAHVLKQHQFNALCALRGWKNKLRLLVDADYPPALRELKPWGLRAEFWIEGIGEDYGVDTNESGVFLRLSSDQVRFYPIAAAQSAAHASGGGYATGHADAPAEPLPLSEIPPLVFSEIMRDVDLFVGVASVGNDPTWADGGPDGHFREYWQSFSFGELTATARTRREVLERLTPRLKIARQCTFEDKFLVVKGKLRTYKIHLGSGNILMSPNDQYLCIVPAANRAAKPDNDGVFLPFEGDRTLAIILSKAFLLAEDHKIKDSSITRQIQTG